MGVLNAYHEAGHAVVGLLLGKSPEETTIRPGDDGSGGHTLYLGEARSIIAAAERGDVDFARQRTMAGLIATAAGPAAQAMHMRGGRTYFLDRDSWATFGGASDFDAAEWILNATRNFVHVDIDDVAEEASDLLEQPNTWAGVTNVAEDLLRFRELDFAGVRDAAQYPFDYRAAIRGQTVVDRLRR
jgi:hypothetical protein